MSTNASCRSGAVLLLVLLLSAGVRADDLPRPAVTPPARIARALLVSIDGLRPDVALRAEAPALRALMARGSFTFWAQTIPAALTLPSHTSMLTGVEPAKHGIVWNGAVPPGRSPYPEWPTLLELARRSGYSTAMVAGKRKFRAFTRPGGLDHAYLPDSSAIADAALADTAVAWIERFAPQVLFVHLPGVDAAGHEHGWGSPAQLAAAAGADSCVGRLLAALERRGLLDSTVVLVTADHGGAGDTHGARDPRSRTIPWIIAGPGIRRDDDLTGDGDLQVRTEDTFATLCFLLGIRVDRPVDGVPVQQILEAGLSQH